MFSLTRFWVCSAAMLPPCLIALIQEGKTGPSAARVISTGKDKEKVVEEEEDRGSNRARGKRKRRRRRRKRKPFLTLLKEDIRYQRGADERREADTRGGSSLCSRAWLRNYIIVTLNPCLFLSQSYVV